MFKKWLIDEERTILAKVEKAIEANEVIDP